MQGRIEPPSKKPEPSSKEKLKSAEKIPSYHTVAVGSGPVGLLSALSALQHRKPGEKVAVLADRREELGVRQQVLWIQEDVFQFIKKMVGEDLINRFMDELAITEDEEDGYYLTTGDFERLLYIALSEYTQGEDYDFIDVQKIAPKQKITDAIQINKEQQVISVQGLAINGVPIEGAPKTCSLNFKNLVAADGARRTLAKAMGEEDVIFDETQRPLHHTKHVVATFRLPEGTTPQSCSKLKVYPGATGAETVSMPTLEDIPFSRDITPCSLAQLKTDFGWKGHTRPHSQIYATRDVVYIGAEMPADLPKEKAREYAIRMMHDQLPQDFIDKMTEIPCDLNTAYGRKMEQLKVSVFDIELGELNKTLQVCANEDEDQLGVIFYMGDAKKNPLYTTGTGVQTGVREVMGFDTYLDSVSTPKLDSDKRTDKQRLRDALESYHVHTQELLGDIRTKQDGWIEGRVKKEKEAEKNFKVFTRYKKSIAELNSLILKVNEAFAKLPNDEIPEIPEFFDQAHTKLNDLKNKYKKVFLCCKGEAHISSYNGVNVEDMIKEFKVIEEEILTTYPSLESVTESLSGTPKEFAATWYNDISEASKQFLLDCYHGVSKSSATTSAVKVGLFSGSQLSEQGPKLNHEPKIDGLTM
ncbi:hypothetical protein [Legionella sp. km772]|uniref:hypothetical protein n=1 Tax=Legionella sp. km772 TaxID=2498111 RepID=UPI000F8D6F98|nr:hypothetical protein [Legionella sp. km772]RUR12313.1 hypothetical protein ELY15_05580 [Legionella sp. km772]